MIITAVAEKKRMAYNTSNAMEAARIWREGRSQVGRAWVRVVETQAVANSGSDEANISSGSM